MLHYIDEITRQFSVLKPYFYQVILVEKRKDFRNTPVHNYCLEPVFWDRAEELNNECCIFQIR